MREAVEEAIDPAPDVVSLLAGVDTAGADIDIVLGPIVTGGEAMVITDDAWIAQNAEALWFERTGGAGPVIGAVIFGLMGMPPEQFIATVYRNRAPVVRFACLSVTCINRLVSGMEDFDAASLPGQPVGRFTGTFSDHGAYLDAHRAALNDTDSWFLWPGDESPQPPDSGMRRVSIDWPSTLVPLPPDFRPDVQDPQARAEIDAWLDTLIDGTDARVTTVYGIERMPLWLQKDGGYVSDADGTVGLHDLSLRGFTIRLEVPEAEVAELEARFQATRPAAADLTPLDPAIARAFERSGLDGVCLPECGDVDRSRLVTDPEFRRGPDPFWTVAVWRIAMPDG